MKRKTLLFTTIGKLSSESKTNVKRAFSSWKKHNYDVIVFGENQHKELCNEYAFNLVLDYERNEFGLPLVKSLFHEIKKVTGYDVYCYINSDITFTKSPQFFIDNIEETNFLLVGQRLDVFPDGRREIHNPGGIDYFFYTPDFWNVEEDAPDFSIARGRFDHWLMGYAYTKGNGIVVDLSKDWLPLHYEPKDRTTGDFVKLFNIGNSKLAYQILRNSYYFGKERLHGQTNMAKYYFENNILKTRVNTVKNEFGELF